MKNTPMKKIMSELKSAEEYVVDHPVLSYSLGDLKRQGRCRRVFKRFHPSRSGTVPTVKQIRHIAEATGVGERYLLTGDLRSKEFPVNDELIAFLENHPEMRKEIWERIGETEDLGTKLKEKRLSLGLTQKEVAEIIGIPRVTVVEIEVGGQKKNYGLMEKVRAWIDE